MMPEPMLPVPCESRRQLSRAEALLLDAARLALALADSIERRVAARRGLSNTH
jgi:hypothetical protein